MPSFPVEFTKDELFALMMNARFQSSTLTDRWWQVRNDHYASTVHPDIWAKDLAKTENAMFLWDDIKEKLEYAYNTP